jgi:crotonobetainyl-CoA:carnitine CoA-transferase CaiB-like acyl-CoA transferase
VSRPGPLHGTRVLDLGQIYQGSYAGLLLALAGADVVKVEPPDGEPLRRRVGDRPPPVQFAVLNAQKRSLALDLKSEAGRDTFLALVDVADVVLENFGPTTMDSLGLGPAVLLERNPRLVYGSGTGYGLSGPDRDHLAMDVTIQAWAGVTSLTGLPEGPPVRAGVAFVDFLGGSHLYGGIVTALVEQARTGRGRVVETAMAEATVHTLASSFGSWFDSGVAPRTGNRQSSNALSPYEMYPTVDGHVAILCVTDRHWRQLCDAMGRPELAADERFDRNGHRLRNAAEVDAIVSEWTATLTRAEVFEAGERHGVPVAPVREMGEVLTDEHLTARGMLAYLPHPEIGTALSLHSPLQFWGTDREPPVPSRRLGEDSDAVLSEWLGWGGDELDSAREAGALG